MTDHAASHQDDNAGVRVPPPLIYVLFFGIGMIMHWIVPLPFLPILVGRVAALIFLAIGVLLAASALVLFRRAHTSQVPIRPTTALVVTGTYRLTRNPMYLGLLCVYCAVALWFGVVWALILVPLVVVAVYHLAIAKEEHYLTQKFGDVYRQYQARVRRWI